MDEARVFVVGNRKAADEELAEVNAVNRTFVFLPVSRAHHEIARRNARQIG